MANAHRCPAGKHQFDLVSGIGAGLQRQKCAICGSVMIDLTEDHELDLVAAGLFAARRSTVFSVPLTPESGDEGFGRPRARR